MFEFVCWQKVKTKQLNSGTHLTGLVMLWLMVFYIKQVLSFLLDEKIHCWAKTSLFFDTFYLYILAKVNTKAILFVYKFYRPWNDCNVESLASQKMSSSSHKKWYDSQKNTIFEAVSTQCLDLFVDKYYSGVPYLLLLTY